ncbi:MAG: hypothetical protein LBU11_03665 [Zoogloeaceae bacterium]|nr:hypothetical protein [Zoogloeaceae bacterium]
MTPTFPSAALATLPVCRYHVPASMATSPARLPARLATLQVVSSLVFASVFRLPIVKAAAARKTAGCPRLLALGLRPRVRGVFQRQIAARHQTDIPPAPTI